MPRVENRTQIINLPCALVPRSGANRSRKERSGPGRMVLSTVSANWQQSIFIVIGCRPTELMPRFVHKLHKLQWFWWEPKGRGKGEKWRWLLGGKRNGRGSFQALS